jgi:tetratricopeptide (TPR) repeat protein
MSARRVLFLLIGSFGGCLIGCGPTPRPPETQSVYEAPHRIRSTGSTMSGSTIPGAHSPDAAIPGGSTRNVAAPAPQGLARTEMRPTLRDVHQARSRALLVTEVQGLEMLASQTKVDAADRPQLLRRIAEDYVEMEAAAERENATALATAARAKAIKTYLRLQADDPTYPQNDQVTYAVAHEYERAGDFSSARRVYYVLINKYPSSQYVPYAYLAFGDLFFDEAERDHSKWDLARVAYLEVLKYPAPRNRAYGYAWYKLAWVLRNQGQRDAASNAFGKAIDFSTSNPSVPGAAKLGEAARADRESLGEPSSASPEASKEAPEPAEPAEPTEQTEP